MSKATDFFAAQTAFNTAIGADIDAIAASSTATNDSVTGLAGDVKNLNDQIAALVAATGDFTPEQQAAADALVAQGTALQAKADAAAASAKATADAAAALDSQTPPVVPPSPPGA